MQFIEAIEDSFRRGASEEVAKKQSAYLRDLFPFLGIVKPTVNALVKEAIKQSPIRSEEDLIHIAKHLWLQKDREYHYVAILILRSYKKLTSEKIFSVLEKMIRENSWWDTVDEIAANLIGPFIDKYPSYIEKMDAWSEDDNYWIRRTSLIFQLRYKHKTDEERLFSFSEKMMHEKEFFIRKAIGWALREYSKTNPVSVRRFLQKNKDFLSPLSIREASRYI